MDSPRDPEIVLRLPELDEPPLLAAPLVRHPGLFTILALALLAASALAVATWVRLDGAVEATGYLEPAGEGVDSSHWRAVLWVAAEDRHEIQLGDPAKIRIHALIAGGAISGRHDGRVTEVAEAATRDGDFADAFRVEVALEPTQSTEGDDPLRQGMTVNGRLLTRSIPAGAIFWRYLQGLRDGG
ncbi:MAG: hypothetical protein AAF560_11870 [Acidobacteriota bacterium]